MCCSSQFFQLKTACNGSSRIMFFQCPKALTKKNSFVVLSLHLDFESENEITRNSEHYKEGQQCYNIDPENSLVKGHFFQELFGVLEVAIGLGAFQCFPVISIDGQHGALKAVSDVGNVGHPLHVRRYVV